jgi:hypothetical protein
MLGHYKDFWASTGLMLCYVALLLDAVLLLWGYQVGQWLRTSRSRSGKTSDDGTLLGSWLLLWLVVY